MLERLEGVLGVFQKLLATKSTDAHACRLLGVVFTAFDAPEVQAYLTPIFSLCLQRLQSNRAVGKSLVAAWSIFVARYTAPALRAQLEAASAGLAANLLTNIWAVHLPNVVGTLPRKTAAISTCRLLVLPEVAADAPTFAATLGGLVTLLLADSGAPKPEAFDDADDDAGDLGANGALGGGGGGGGYQAAYAQLHFASTAEADLYASETPQAAFRQCLEAVGRAAPGMLPAALQQIGAALPAEKQQALQGLMQGVQIS